MIVTNIVGAVILCIGILVALWALLNIVKFLLMFHGRHCKYCGRIMEFKGFKENDGKGAYDFHCEHCGAWERLTRNELFGEDKASVA